MKNFYVFGGKQRAKVPPGKEEWHLYDKALALSVDAESGAARVVYEYVSPSEVQADEFSSVLFKSGSRVGDRLYLCTSTEVLIFEVPGFQRVGYVSLPCFNDLHHVSLTSAGNLIVASTGLDMVVEFTTEGKVLRDWNVLGGDPWSRFSREVDYRQVATTKPHLSHPNFVFQIGKEIWVTRFNQKDAVCLTHADQRIEVGIERPHDGLVWNGKVYFTTVDGKLVIADPHSHQISEIIDLTVIDNQDGALLGWCRGVMVADERSAWVGFTRVRKTKFVENILWVKHAFRDVEKPTHIALYDLQTKRCLKEIDLEKYGMNIVFNMLPAMGD